MREYVNDLKWMSVETKWFGTEPKILRLADVAELRGTESQKAASVAFDNAKILVNKYSRSPDTRVRYYCVLSCLRSVFKLTLFHVFHVL